MIKDNPWKNISLSDYENHMSLESVRQLQSLNQTMKSQFDDYDVKSVMILGIAGGNGLEHIDTQKFQVVYGVDVNESYLKVVADRYKNLDGVLKCLSVDVVNDADRLPMAELLIANLFVEYVGYKAFAKTVLNTCPRYVSCVIQINEKDSQWVSDSPYIHSFDSLDSVHCQMDEKELVATMNSVGYELIKKYEEILPNGKSFLRLDYQNNSF